ncbi:helix-turn-helix domain-containing protein [Paenibacillus pabuli]|uniref:helix-turn-helix domain-containing protein n=1 Tax=Paenibacillus pabuli TaxID=1472 RepID=UPI003CEC9C65
MSQRESVFFKTVLEYLVMINEQSYSGIGRQLHITPQQFSDWIKKRRPIPQERLQALADYFGVDGAVFVDTNNFVKPLTPLEKVNIHILLLDQKLALLEKEGAEDEEIGPYRAKKQKLLKERAEQDRLAKIAATLQLNDERINRILDYVIHKLESGRVEELEMKLNKGEEQR